MTRKKTVLTSLLAASLLSTLAPLISVAAPQVNYNTISWPDDGWYEVQRYEDQSSVCRGGSTCTVDPGQYIVINHTLQQRFAVTVATHTETTPANSHNGVTVSSNQVIVPDDGWYQVQSADTYATLCEGTRTCTVPPGTYNVINLTTNTRFDNLQVPASDSPDTDVTSVSVTGNLLRWPDDGWYQVQDASTFETLCEGGRECRVPNGIYNVINHTLSVRTEQVEVNGDSANSPPAISPVVDGLTIVLPDNGWYQVQDDATLASICEGVRRCDVSPGSYTVINHTTDQRWERVTVAAPDGDSLTPIDTAQSPMLFLSTLGLPPYASLPVMEYQPLSRNIRFNADEILPTALNGCLSERIGLYYCFRASDRTLLSLLATGEPHWSFTLPGDNQTNRIDGIALTDYNRLALVTNVTTEFGTPKHEVSYFSSQGAFIDTNDLFQINGTTWPTINLQGEPLIVERGSISNLQNWPYTVTGNFYELTAGGNRANPADWTQAGVIEAVIDPQTNEYQRILLCDGARESADGAVGIELCEDSGYQVNLTRNTAQSRLRDAVGRLTDGTFEAAAMHLPEARQAATAAGLVTDLSCVQDLSDANCFRDLLPNIGSTQTSSTVTIDCPVPTWNQEIFQETNGTAQLQQRLTRVSDNDVTLIDQLSFTERCAFTGLNGELTGQATLHSNIALNDGSITVTETNFEDLGVIVGGNYRRFINATYRTSGDSSSTGKVLTASRIDSGALCSRSCPPSFSVLRRYTDFSLQSDTTGSGDTHYQFETTRTTLRDQQLDPTVQPSSIRGNLVDPKTAASNSNLGATDSFVELTDGSGSKIRVTPVINSHYPTIPFVNYELVDTDGAAKNWQLPASSFLEGDIVRLEGALP